MPKIMRELAPGGTFFDPRYVWEAEQNKVQAQEEEARRKAEEAEKARLEEEKKQERLQNRMKKLSVKDEGGASEAGAAEAAEGGDMKWRKELAGKMAQARKAVEADAEGCGDSDKAEEAFNDFVGKLEKVWADSAKAASKSQKTECEKKVEKLAKAAQKQLKEIKEEEKGGAGGGGGKKRAEAIREKLEAKKQVDDVEDDVQIISNVLSKFKRSTCCVCVSPCVFVRMCMWIDGLRVRVATHLTYAVHTHHHPPTPHHQASCRRSWASRTTSRRPWAGSSGCSRSSRPRWTSARGTTCSSSTAFSRSCGCLP